MVPVLQEVEDGEDATQHCERDPERRELLAAQVPDDGRVDEEVQRLGSERAQRRKRETGDLAVVLRTQPHTSSAWIVASNAVT